MNQGTHLLPYPSCWGAIKDYMSIDCYMIVTSLLKATELDMPQNWLFLKTLRGVPRTMGCGPVGIDSLTNRICPMTKQS